MFKKFGNYMIAGIVLALPIAITIFVFMFLIRNIGTPVTQIVLEPIFHHLDTTLPHSMFGKIMLDLFSTLVVITFVTVLGVISKFFFARWIIDITETAINKIPAVGLVYRTVKQIVDTFSKQKKAVFQSAVLVEFPRKGLYSVGFVTGTAQGEVKEKTGEDFINVFVPTTPNPTSGFLVITKEEEIKYLDMTVGEAMKLIISGGAVTPQNLKQKSGEDK